jgi:hypothetical protein
MWPSPPKKAIKKRHEVRKATEENKKTQRRKIRKQQQQTSKIKNYREGRTKKVGKGKGNQERNETTQE